MTQAEFEALGEGHAVYYCPYDTGDEDAGIYTICFPKYEVENGKAHISGYYRDGNYDEFDPKYIFKSADDCLDHIGDEDVEVIHDGEVIRLTKADEELKAYCDEGEFWRDNNADLRE